MATLPTRLEAYINATQNEFDNKETRFRKPQGLNAFLDQQSMDGRILNADFESKFKANYPIERTGGTTVQIPVFNDLAVSITTGMSCDDAITENVDTDMVTTQVPVYVGFEFQEPTLNVGLSNHFSLAEMFTNAMNRGFAAVNDQLNVLCLAALDAGKNQLFDAPVLVYPETLGVYQVATGLQSEAFGTIPSIHSEMNFDEDMQIIGGVNLEPKIKHWTNQADGNSTNLRYQFEEGNKKFYLGSSSFVSDVGGKLFYAVSNGTTGIVSRVAPNYYRPELNAGLANKEMGIIKNPFNGIEFGIDTTTSCANDTKFNSKSVKHQVGAEFLITVAYNSDIANKYSAISKYLFLN